MGRFQKILMMLFLVVMSFGLAGCSGSDDAFSGDDSGNGGSGSSGGSGGSSGGGGSTTTNLSLALSLVDTANQTTTTSISSDSSGTIIATLTDEGTGAAISGALISATTSLGTFNPASGTALTDASGRATLELIAGSTTGADNATITADYNSLSAVQLIGYSVAAPTIQIGSGGTGTSFTPDTIDLGLSAIAAGGSTSVTVNLVDGSDAAYTPPVSVSFSSPCILATTSTIDPPVTTIGGVATATYTATGCVGTDTITATANVGGSTFTASGNVVVNPASAGSIEFTSATPTVIAIQGTGGSGLTETSEVIFTVKDDQGQVVANQNVDFALNTTVGGITLNVTSGVSDASGEVKVIVNSGTVNTSVRVTATLTGTSISTESVALAISTGLPDQNSFSISFGDLNPNSWSYNGVQVPITIFVADHFNNPAPDGTAVAFESEGGFIDGSCNTVAGSCVVSWVSSDPRPANGRVTILATAIGEEGFTDTNGNGRFDDGESFTDLPEAWRDDNENDDRDANEEFKDFDVNGNYGAADTTYNGTLCAAISTTCNPAGDLVHVRDYGTLVMASDDQLVALYDVTGTTIPIGGAVPSGDNLTAMAIGGSGIISLPDDGSLVFLQVDVQDVRGQAPPSGTSISAITDNGSLKGPTSITLGSTRGFGPASLGLAITADTTIDSGILTITVNYVGNSVAGSSSEIFTFSVVETDVTGPTVASTTPAAGAAGIAVNTASVVVAFDDDMMASTINASTVTLSPPVAGTPTVSYDVGSKKAFYFLSADMTPDTLYTVTVKATGGAVATDTDGNVLNDGAVDHTFVFKTALP